MYFIEKIFKLFQRKKYEKIKYTPQNIDNCNHMFLPIDSSGEVLACSKCGKLINRREFDKSN